MGFALIFSTFSSFETENGINRNEDGYLKDVGAKHPAQVMSGSYSYTGPDGKVRS